MITRKRVKTFNKMLTCLLCKGYLIEATTINTCMHSFCRSCIVKHVKKFEKYFCPSCETEIRLSNLRPDMRLRSIVYKLIPGLYAKEHHKAIEINGRSKSQLKLHDDVCHEDATLSKQYFYDSDEPISLSLEYHMESILGNAIASLNNIPQVRYLQAPAAFRVNHLKKFLSSKYDLSNLKKSMNIDIIYEGDILADDYSLLDIAYTYRWQRDAPLKLFYRIYKGSKHNASKLKMIERALNRQPYVSLSSELRESLAVRHSNGDSQKRGDVNAPRHDLKIIIAKKTSSRTSSKNIGASNNKVRLNKPNGNGSKVLSDFGRLRGADVDSEQFSSASSSDFVSTSETKTTLSKKSGTVSHHDLKSENKSNTKKHNSSNSDSHAYYESSTVSEREREKKRESAKHAKKDERSERLKTSSRSGLALNIPKLKIELPSLKTKITVPRTPTDKYVISSKSPSLSPKCDSPSKRVRFDISTKERSYDFVNEGDINSVDQMEYAERIGLKPVERKVESIILLRKRKKSKHSRDSEHSKRPKLHVSSSLDESLKLKLKIMGGKSCKNDKKPNEDEATCNLRAVPCKTADSTSINEREERQIKEKQQPPKEPSSVLENHKYSVAEQTNAKSSGSYQPMVFIPKLVLQKTPSANATSDKSASTMTSNVERKSSFVVEPSKSTSSEPNACMKLKVKPFESIASSDLASQKLMKPPTAKMGSPKQSTIALSPIRPHSIPASLKLSPISQSPPTSIDFQLQSMNLKRSLSLGAEKSSPSYLNAYIKPNKNIFPSTSSTDTISVQYAKVPPLISSTASSTSSAMRNFYGSMSIAPSKLSQSPQHTSKLPNINVKDAMKLFPNACPSVEILKIPQKTYAPPSVKLNRPLPAQIPLERIKKSAQNPVSQKILPKPPMNQNVVKPQGFHQSPQCSSQTLNYSGIYETPINRDISLDRYTLELTHDIAKLDRSLSLEKNFESWERRKLQEYSRLNDLRNFPMPQPPKSHMLHQQQNLSVRHIPNPSAIMMSRNQSFAKPAGSMPQKETVTSTNSESSDFEEMLSKSTIARGGDLSSQKSPGSKVNDKKSIEKLTEYLRLTAAKSKDAKHDDDNNNNSNADESSANSNRNFNLMQSKTGKFMNVNLPSVDVICIDS